MIKYFFLLFCYSTFAFSQILKPPATFSKVTFVYETKSNYHFDALGVYADTFLLKRDLPQHKYILAKSPSDSSKWVGYIAKSGLTTKGKDKLQSILFHTNSRSRFVYDVKSNTTETTTTLSGDKETIGIFKNFFGEKRSGVVCFPVTINYNDNQKAVSSTDFTTQSHDYKNRMIKWSENDTNSGTFEHEYANYKYTDAIVVNPELGFYITPIMPFTNCNFGISAIYSVDCTTTLILVSYK